MARQRIVDSPRHCFIPNGIACIALVLITGALQTYSMYFMFAPWNWVMMAYMIGIAAIGLVAVFTGRILLTFIYMVAQMLAFVPVIIVVGFMSYLLNNFNEYGWYLYENFEYGMCWSGEAVSCLSVPFIFLNIANFRKLRHYQIQLDSAFKHGNYLEEANRYVEEDQQNNDHPVDFQQSGIFTTQQSIAFAVPTANEVDPTVYPDYRTSPYATSVILPRLLTAVNDQ